MRIGQILQRKGGDVATIEPTASIVDVIDSLGTHGVGALVVSSDGKTIGGIISERDIVRSLATLGAATLEATAAELMTAEVFTCELDATTEQLMSEMTKGRFRHVPVVEAGVLVGIISIGDVVNARVDELEIERQQLTDYISGR
jgi:CBS domain-containing protein